MAGSRVRRRWQVCGLMIAAVAWVLPCAAQEGVISTIEAEGVATVDIMPGYVEFWFHKTASGASFAEAARKAADFEKGFRQQVQSFELKPADLFFSNVAIPDVQNRAAYLSARVRFNASAYSTAEDGPQQFAVLCDKALALAAALDCTAEGPRLGVDDTEPVEEAAVARAIEKAYPAGKAAAQTMNGQIYAVSNVALTSITWNRAPDITAQQPDIRRLTCTARVRVTYVFVSTGS